MVPKQRQESLRRLSPRNIPGNHLLLAFRTTAPYILQITGYSFGSKTCLLFERKINFNTDSLTAIFNLKFDYLILGQILELYMNLSKDGKDIVFIWVSAMWALVAIRLRTLHLRMPSLATSRLSSSHFIPFSDLKSRANKYILQLGQSEWDEFPDNKLHKMFPVLKECVICPRTNRKEETVVARLHTGHSFTTHSFLLN